MMGGMVLASSSANSRKSITETGRWGKVVEFPARRRSDSFRVRAGGETPA